MQASPLFRNPIRCTLVFFAITAGLNSPRLEAAETGQTQKVVNAADAVLRTLDEPQRGKMSFDFNDAAQRIRWSNLPLSMAERRGLLMGELKPGQRDVVDRFFF